MTDYFALLDQPRAPWLDPEVLREAYHRRTRATHPDTAKPGSDTNFAEVNEAYEVLQDPKRRLHHLLSLENCAPASTNTAVPSELQDLFPAIGELTQRAKLLLEKMQATSNALGRSLLKPRIIELQTETRKLRDRLRDLSEVSVAQLREMNSDWSDKTTALAELYLKFAYLGRWCAQLDELSFQLSML
jgi:curved DNA-binding protein CbpA